MIQSVDMISAVIPLLNESESIKELVEHLKTELLKLKSNFEIVFVDDGSKDNSLEVLKNIYKTNESVRIFSFRKNQGKAEALTFGFQKAKGDYIITLDADLQDKPHEISKLLGKAKEGWDVVCGWRRNRQDSLFKVLSSKLFNWIAGLLWGLKLHDYNCGLKVYTKDAAKSQRLYGGMHRFIPLIAYQQGFKVTEVSVEHNPRKYGTSKYGFSKIWRDFPDIFTMLFLSRYGNRPLHFFGSVGGVLLVTGGLIFAYLTILWFQGESIGRRPLLQFSILLMLAGLQIFFTGFLADLILNISRNSNGSFDSESLLKFSSESEN